MTNNVVMRWADLGFLVVWILIVGRMAFEAYRRKSAILAAMTVCSAVGIAVVAVVVATAGSPGYVLGLVGLVVVALVAWKFDRLYGFLHSHYGLR
jgi:hypothetical protein